MFHERLAGRDDDVVWQAVQGAGRFLVTQDLDFSDARKYLPGTHHGLLLSGWLNPVDRPCTIVSLRCSVPRTSKAGTTASFR